MHFRSRGPAEEQKKKKKREQERAGGRGRDGSSERRGWKGKGNKKEWEREKEKRDGGWREEKGEEKKRGANWRPPRRPPLECRVKPERAPRRAGAARKEAPSDRRNRETRSVCSRGRCETGRRQPAPVGGGEGKGRRKGKEGNRGEIRSAKHRHDRAGTKRKRAASDGCNGPRRARPQPPGGREAVREGEGQRGNGTCGGRGGGAKEKRHVR